MFIPRKSKRDSTHTVFEELVGRHEISIYRVAYRLTGNHEDAEDLIQEALLEAYKAFASFRPGTYFDRWLFRILRNTYIDGVRSRPRLTLQSLDAPLELERGAQVQREIVDVSAQPETKVLAAVLDEPIQQALMALPEEFRLVVVLSDIEGLSYEEVSQVAGCPVGTVRSRLHRGRMLLKERLRTQSCAPVEKSKG
jgi:RNA polymerase sigma-70 factor (ECF subfamily)